jgi:hypothetical protein
MQAKAFAIRAPGSSKRDGAMNLVGVPSGFHPRSIYDIDEVLHAPPQERREISFCN